MLAYFACFVVVLMCVTAPLLLVVVFIKPPPGGERERDFFSLVFHMCVCVVSLSPLLSFFFPLSDVFPSPPRGLFSGSGTKEGGDF